MRMIQREHYLKKLIRNMWNGEIKVITGILIIIMMNTIFFIVALLMFY